MILESVLLKYKTVQSNEALFSSLTNIPEDNSGGVDLNDGEE